MSSAARTPQLVFPGRKGLWYFDTRPLDPEASKKLEAALWAWEDTPYLEGAAMAGKGADCFRALAGVIADLEGVRPQGFDLLPADAAMNAPETARAAMRDVIRVYSAEPVTDGVLEPGDFIVTSPPGADTGPGHAMMLGPMFRLWHMDRTRGFCSTGPSLQGYLFSGAYRTPKERWV